MRPSVKIKLTSCSLTVDRKGIRYVGPLKLMCNDLYLKFTKGVKGFNIDEHLKGYFHLCPRMDFLQTLHINYSLYKNYENVFIELAS